MNRKELIKALKRLKVETGSLACMGCGHEHNCSVSGCAIIRAAVEELEEFAKQYTPTPPKRSSRDGMGYTYYDYCCPQCGRRIAYEPEAYKHKHEKYCFRCGQAILWPEVSEDG